MILPLSKPPCRRGFTLVELIVAMAIFTVILLLTAQVSNSALTITRRTEARGLRAECEALKLEIAQLRAQCDSPHSRRGSFKKISIAAARVDG